MSSNTVEEPRAYYTEWSKSEREKQIPYMNTHAWNLERWYWWTYLQSSSGDTDIENRLAGTVGEGEGGTNGKSKNLLFDTVLCDNLEKWNGARGRRGHMYIYGWFMLMYEFMLKLAQYWKAIILQLKRKKKKTTLGQSPWQLEGCPGIHEILVTLSLKVRNDLENKSLTLGGENNFSLMWKNLLMWFTIAQRLP